MPPSPTREWQKPTGAKLEMLPNLKKLLQPTVPTVPPTVKQQKQMMAIVAGLHFYDC